MSGHIFKQVFLVSMVFFLLCCTLFGVTAYTFTVKEYVEQLQAETDFAATCVETAGEDFLQQIPTPTTERLTWLSADGGVLYDTAFDPATIPVQAGEEEVQEALASGWGESRRYAEEQNSVMQFMAVRLSDGTVVRLAARPYSVMTLLDNLFYPMLLALVLAVGLSVLVALWVSKGVTRPINAIDLTGQDERDVYPELRPLVRRINTQNRQIQYQVEELKTEHEKQDALRREFTANVTHELKTPLTSISGFAELMRDGVVKGEDVSRFGGKIYDESRRLITLVEDIIKLSRLDSRLNMPEKAPVDLTEVCEMVMSHLEHVARRKSVQLVFEGEPVTVLGVEPILYEMVYNLCDNAIKYNRPDGSVTLRLFREAQGCVLTVTDTGIGIPPEEQERIFERFYRVDKSHSKEVGGTGLGLSIVKHGALLHRATVRVDSTPGVGTTLTVSFPATAALE